MDWLTFIAELVKALAWPSVALAALLIFRSKLVGLFPFLSKIKIGLMEASFAERVAEVEVEVKKAEVVDGAIPLSPTESRGGQLALPDVEALEKTPSLQALQEDLAGPSIPGVETNWPGPLSSSGDPQGSILQSWANVQNALRFVVRESNLGGASGSSVDAMVNELMRRRYISHELANVVRKLHSLRNGAVHGGFVPDPSVAFSFTKSAKKAAALLIAAADEGRAMAESRARE